MNNKIKTQNPRNKKVSPVYFFQSVCRNPHRRQIRSNFTYLPGFQFNKCNPNNSYKKVQLMKNQFSKSVKQSSINNKIHDIYNSKLFSKFLKNEPEIQQKLYFLLNGLIHPINGN